MIAVFVLAILAGGFAAAMKVETRLAQHANNETELRTLGISGVHYAQWILALQASCPMEPYDALTQTWAGGGGGPCATNSGMIEVQNEVHVGNGYFTWKITDHERYWNINSLLAPGGDTILQQALNQVGADAADYPVIVGSVLDWIDTDESTHVQGSESDYYESLNPPYEAKNGPFDDISELLMVKGVTWDMYSGTASADRGTVGFPANFGRPQVNPEMASQIVGFTNLFTAVSAGKININTASAAVLQLIPGMDPLCAEAIVGARGGEDDGSGLTGPYRSIDQLRRVPCVSLELVRQIQRFADVTSRTFEVEITAHVGGSSRTFYGTVVRVNGPRDRNSQILNFYWKI
jgi:general secretion pathway protein K